MKKMVYLMLIVCLSTQTVFGADAALIPDTIRLENVLESFAEPDFGIKVGKIDMIQGKAILIHLGSTQAYWVKEEYPLFKGDTIITLKGGRIRLQLNDGSILTLASETRLVINQSVYDPDAKSRSSFMGMAVGKARFVVRKIQDALQSDFKIKTQTAVVGVRGSDFIVEADANVTKVVTLDNTRLEIISLADPKMEQTVLNDYEKIVVGHDLMPSAIESVSIEDAKRMMREMDIAPVSPEKFQVNAEKLHKGFHKDVIHAVPETVKKEINAVAIEKTEANHHAITSEKTKIGQVEKSETVKIEPSQKTEIKTEIVIELPKTEQPDLKVDVQGSVAKDKLIEFVKATQVETVELKTVEVPKLEALDIKVFEISKSYTIQQSDTVRSVVADIVHENKEVIQSNVSEIKVLSAQDVSGSSSLTGTVHGNIVINPSLGGSSSENTEKSASGASQVVIVSPIADNTALTFTPPSQLESPIRQTDAAERTADTPVTTLPDMTKPATTLPANTTKPATETTTVPDIANSDTAALSHNVKPADSSIIIPTAPDAIKPLLPDTTTATTALSHTTKPATETSPPVTTVSDIVKSSTTLPTDMTKPATDVTAPVTTLPDVTKPATTVSDTAISTTFLPNIQTQLPAPTISPTSPLISPATLINRQ